MPQVTTPTGATRFICPFAWLLSILLLTPASGQIPLVTLEASPTSLNEGGLATATITANLSGAPIDGVNVELQTAGTADAADFELSSTLISIPYNATSGSVTLSIVDDGFVEGLEIVRIEIATVSGALEDGDQEVEVEIIDDDLVLPVELSAFRVVRNGRDLTATWQTESEVGNVGFFVELSADRVNFRDVGWVDGNGTTSGPRGYAYSFSAPTAVSGAYVRLRQIDSDGSVHFSQMVEVAGEDHYRERLEIYPNPARGSATVILSSTEDEIVVTVHDLLGREVKRLRRDASVLGPRELITFDVADLASGLYLVRAKGASGVSVQSLHVSN